MVAVAVKVNVPMANVIAHLDSKVKIVPNAKNAQMAVAPTVSAAAADAYAYQVTLAKIAPMHLHARKIHVKMVYVHKDVVSVMMDGLAKHVH